MTNFVDQKKGITNFVDQNESRVLAKYWLAGSLNAPEYDDENQAWLTDGLLRVW